MPWTHVRIVVALISLLGTGASAGTLHVDGSATSCPGSGSVASPFCTIQAAVVAAQAGDTVLVQPGTYVEAVDFLGKAITVESAGGPATTVIDGGSAGRVVTFQSGEGLQSTLRGFTIRNGKGGILVIGASPTIEQNVVTANDAVGSAITLGGGIYLQGGAPLVRENLVATNHAANGGGVAVLGPATLERNVFDANTVIAAGVGSSAIVGSAGASFRRNTHRGKGSVVHVNSSAAFEHEEFVGAPSGAVIVEGFGPLVQPILRRCTFMECQLAVGFQGDVTLQSSVLRSSASSPASVLPGANITASYSNVQGGWPGVGNLDVDPQFVDAVNGDLRLMPTSPCIEVGDPADVGCGVDRSGRPARIDRDLDGVRRVDMGAHEASSVDLTIAAVPGQLVVDASGPAGLAGFMAIGVAPGLACVEPVGAFLVDVQSPFLLIPWPMPSVAPIAIPAGPLPPTVRFQLFGVAAGFGAGQASNAVDVSLP